MVPNPARGQLNRENVHVLCVCVCVYLLKKKIGCSDGMEREACVCDHGYERSDLCAEIIITAHLCMCVCVLQINRSGLNHTQ